MAKAKAAELNTVDQLDLVVSCDDHSNRNIDDWIPYMDSRYSGIVEWIKKTDNPKSELFSITPPIPPYGLGTQSIGGEKEHLEHDTTVETKIAQMDEFGVDVSILNHLLHLPSVQNRQVAAALANGRNEWIVQEIEGEDRLRASITAVGQKPDHAAEDIDRWADEDCFVAVQLPASGNEPPISHEWYDPIYQAAQDNGLPMTFHGSYPAMSAAFPMQHRWNQIVAEDKVITHPFTHMWNLTNMIYEGIPERFPDLEFVIQEAGIGWIPYMIWRLDYYYLMYGDEMPMLTQLPSSYIEEKFYFTSQPVGHTERNPEHLAWMVEMAGPDNIMYAADLPHTDFQPPEELFDRIKNYFDRETVENIMGETANDVFDLGM